MTIHFSKYQGTGNDFIMIDAIHSDYSGLTEEQIRFLCAEKFGVGADGLILLEKKQGVDFYVNYYNSDGSQSFCGNGARCAIAFAFSCGIISGNCRFGAIDGTHEGEMLPDGTVRLKMGKISGFRKMGEDYFLDTGSPHYVRFLEQETFPDIVTFGKQIRYNDEFRVTGTNVNHVVEKKDGTLWVETYERGVEDETYSCGTGVTAVALLHGKIKNEQEGSRTIVTKGGTLNVRWKTNERGAYEEVWLEGPAVLVFKGEIDV